MALVQQMWHGDNEELIKKFKPGRIQSVICDPPFGVDNQSNSAVTPEGREMARKIANDESPEIALAHFERVVEGIMPAMKEESDFYIFTSHQVLEPWLVRTNVLFARFGYERKAIMVWEKDGPGQGDLATWGMGIEFILYYKRGRRTQTDKRRNVVFHVPQIRPADLIHPHQKPEALLEMMIKHSTNRGDLVVDPWGGSGSLYRAAVNTERSVVTMELDEFNFKQATKLNERRGEAMF